MRSKIAALVILGASAALAQESDRDYLTAFLEDSLSGAGREVTVTGFSGALSAQASLETLTIADDEGIWLTLSDVTLDWSRSALLSGVVDVSELSAQRIEVLRLPEAEDTALPSPEAAGFILPELPVSISIDRLSAAEIVLGESVLGQPVQGRMDAALQLAAGAGTATLDMERLGDGPKGRISLDAGYDNTTRVLSVSLSAAEDAGGIVATALDIPGAPSAELSIDGAGPLEDFAADIALETDGEARLTGRVTLSQSEGERRITAEVSGNLAPLLVPDQVDFFGSEVSLSLDAARSAVGEVRVDRFNLQARSLSVEGSGRLAADGLPLDVSFSGILVSPDGVPVLLPFATPETRIDRAGFDISFTAGTDAGWKAGVDLLGLDRADLAVARLRLDGSGRIGRTPAGNSFGGTLTTMAMGVDPSDAGLAQAIGTDLTGSMKFHFLGGSDAFSFSDLRLTGEGVTARGSARIEGLSADLLTTGDVSLELADLSRFATLIGQPLSGTGILSLTGSASGLSGYIDAEAAFDGQGLKVGIDPLDRMLAGETAARLSLLRDKTGTTLRYATITAGPFSADAAGKLASAGSDLTGNLRLSDLTALGPGYGGSLDLTARFTGTSDTGLADLSGQARSVRTGLPELDRLLAGTTDLKARVGMEKGRILLSDADLRTPQLSFVATGGATDAGQRLQIDARLSNLGLVVPRLDGPFSLGGSVTETADGYLLDLSGRGPGQIDGRVRGTVNRNFGTTDLQMNGTGQAVLANLFIAPRAVEGQLQYDLRLNGPPRLTSLSGRVTMARGRLTDPGLGFAIERVEAIIDLADGRASLSATGGVSSGGSLRIDGPVSLAAPYPADLTVAMDGIRLTDPELYETRLGGSLRVTGPLQGGGLVSGTVSLEQAELRVPSSGFETAGALLNLRHVNEPQAVRETRIRAGLTGREGGGRTGGASGAPFRLDVTVFAPSQVFVRGRGIDAELGGQLRLTGSTDEVVPAGGFSLIRGRLDILGKRLVLSRAELVLEGSFLPVLDIAATTESDGIASTVSVTGPADNPVVSFVSSPPLPQEEVLARLLFGRALESISALQAAQLANAVAVLAGRGGEGLVGRLRKSFGLDDLDLATAEDGSTALTAGKYLTENVYTEVEVEQGGKSRISLNLDLRDGVTVKAGVGDDGNTGLGIFLEKDY